MDKYEFITNLQRHLTGKVSTQKLQEITAYYSDYIDSEIRRGKSEKEVLDQLGDPRLLAKTIVETEGNGSYGDVFQTVYEDERNGGKSRRRSFRMNIKSWIFRLLVILIICLICYVLFGIIGLAFNILFTYVLPVAIPVLIVYMIIQLLKK